MELTVKSKNHQTGPKGIPIELVIDYARKGLSVTEVSRMLNCDPANVSRRLKRVGFDAGRLDSFIKNRADILAFKQSELISQINEPDIKKMSPRDRVLAFGILYDKERLERGQSTANIAYQEVSTKLAAIDKELQELESKG